MSAPVHEPTLSLCPGCDGRGRVIERTWERGPHGNPVLLDARSLICLDCDGWGTLPGDDDAEGDWEDTWTPPAPY